MEAATKQNLDLLAKAANREDDIYFGLQGLLDKLRGKLLAASLLLYCHFFLMSS